MSEPTAEHCRIAARWLLQLSQITAAGAEPLDAEKLALYADLLARDFGPAAFNRTTLHAVAHGNRFFPPYEAIRAAMRATLDGALALTADDRAGGLSKADTMLIELCRKRLAEGPPPGFASAADGGVSRVEAYRALQLAMLKRASEAAWRHVTSQAELLV